MSRWSRGPKEPREVILSLSGIPEPAEAATIPNNLRIEHTIIRKPDPRPHTITAVLRDPAGFYYRGQTYYLGGTPSVAQLYLPGNFVYFRDNDGKFIALSCLDVEFGWS